MALFSLIMLTTSFMFLEIILNALSLEALNLIKYATLKFVVSSTLGRSY